MAEIVPCPSAAQAPQAIARAAEVLRSGGLVIFPTETVYGVGAGVMHESALKRLRQVKNRPDDKPFTVHIGHPKDVEKYADPQASPLLRRLVRRTMPGPVTIVTEVDDPTIHDRLQKLGLPADAEHRLYHEKMVGLRCPDHAVAATLLSAVNQPVVASSANPAGQTPPTQALQAAACLGDQVDLILDAGPTRYAQASTIITLRDRHASGVRGGFLDERYLKKLMQLTILFVCSGNTCRSPMAQSIARHELKKLKADFHILSAGTSAWEGSPMTDEAVQAMKEIGVEPHRHRSQGLTAQLIRQADAIYCMSDFHMQAVHRLAPDAADRARLLDPDGSPVDDPIGAGLETYVKCAKRLRELIHRRLEELGFTPANVSR